MNIFGIKMVFLFGSCLVCTYHMLLELIWLCISGALISVSGRVGWEQSVMVSLCCFRVGVIPSAVSANFETRVRVILATELVCSRLRVGVKPIGGVTDLVRL